MKSSVDYIVLRPRNCAGNCADCLYGWAEETVRDGRGRSFFLCRESTKVLTKYCLGTDCKASLFLPVVVVKMGYFAFKTYLVRQIWNIMCCDYMAYWQRVGGDAPQSLTNRYLLNLRYV